MRVLGPAAARAAEGALSRRVALALALLATVGGTQCAPTRALPPSTAPGPLTVTIAQGGHPLHPRVGAIAVPRDREILLIDRVATPATGPHEIVVRADGHGPPVEWRAERGTIQRRSGGLGRRVRYRAPPEAGLDEISVRWDDAPEAAATIHVLVLHPPPRASEVLHGYRIGRYPPPPAHSDPRRKARTTTVAGLFPLTEETRDLPLTTHLTLGSLACKQQPGHVPAYLAVEPRLLDKLERLRDLLVAAGHDPAALRIMSAYRTPHYNAAIGNRTRWSRHTIGDAADVYVDADGDERMDDLDGDGSITIADAHVLLALVEQLDEDPALVGGASAYPANAAHGPFVHLDTRGYRARW